VGDVFVFAYLIIPSSIGILLSKKVKNVFLIAILVGAIVPPISIYLAFKFDFSSGPMAVVVSFILFMLVFLFKKIKK
jgi:ABC-type Mn2+/Zn2+ transport system permease subunit